MIVIISISGRQEAMSRDRMAQRAGAAKTAQHRERRLTREAADRNAALRRPRLGKPAG